MKHYLVLLNACFLILVFANAVNAQYVSYNDKNGNVKSIETRRYEESQKTKTVNTSDRKASNKPSTATSEVRSTGSTDWAHIAKMEKESEISFYQKTAKYQNVEVREKLSYLDLISIKLRASLNGKFGYVDYKGDVIIPFIYDDVSTKFTGPTSMVKIGNKFGFINYHGEVFIPIKYDKIYQSTRIYVTFGYPKYYDIAFVQLNGKYGLIGLNGATVIPAIYEELEQKSNYNLYAAKLNGKWGFLDLKGATKIAFQYDSVISSFAIKGIATVIKDNSKFNIDVLGFTEGPKTDITTGKILPMKGLETSTFTDLKNNKIYPTIKIGDQVWMSKNLDNAQFANGDIIPEASSAKAWNKANKQHKPAWCYYKNDPANAEKYGKLYNWYAVIDPRGLAPAGWHIPHNYEWQKMFDQFGGIETAGRYLVKSEWHSNSNASGFSAYPAGDRKIDFFSDLSISSSSFWAIGKDKYSDRASTYLLSYENIYNSGDEGEGISVRCIENAK